MKTKPILLATLALASPLALAAASRAFAQASAEPSPPPSSAAPRDSAAFLFPGGTPRQFVQAIEKQFQAQWSEVADIPPDMGDLRIPALRLSRESLEPIVRSRRGGGGGGFRGQSGGFGGTNEGGFGFRSPLPPPSPLEALVALYNSLQRAKPELGELIVQGDLLKPSVVLFCSRQSSVDFRMKAFPLRGIPEPEWEKLAELILKERDVLVTVQGLANRPERNQIRVDLHRDTGLLVVLGPESVLETVDSFVNAWRANQEQVRARFPVK